MLCTVCIVPWYTYPLARVRYVFNKNNLTIYINTQGHKRQAVSGNCIQHGMFSLWRGTPSDERLNLQTKNKISQHRRILLPSFSILKMKALIISSCWVRSTFKSICGNHTLAYLGMSKFRSFEFAVPNIRSPPGIFVLLIITFVIFKIAPKGLVNKMVVGTTTGLFPRKGFNSSTRAFAAINQSCGVQTYVAVSVRPIPIISISMFQYK